MIKLFFLMILFTMFLIANEKYFCPMHPNVISDKPGECPICHMPLQKRNNNQNDNNENLINIEIGKSSEKLLGMTYALVTKMELKKEILASGRVAFDPELFVTMEEYKHASKLYNAINANDPMFEDAKSTFLSAKKKLKLLGITEQDINESKEEDLYVYADIFPSDASSIKVGAKFEALTESFKGKVFHGKITSISSIANSIGGTIRLRGKVYDSGSILKPDMYLNLKINLDEKEKKLLVPRGAILFSGNFAYAFVASKDSNIEKRIVTLGTANNEFYEILSGLKEGERIITSANFLIDSESKINETTK